MSTKITIAPDDLNSPAVEARLQQQAAVYEARNQYQSQTPSKLDDRRKSQNHAKLWYSAVLTMAAFGLAGGLMAWGCGQLRHLLEHPGAQKFQDLRFQVESIVNARAGGQMSPAQADAALTLVRQDGRDNDYFQIYDDPALSASDKDARLLGLEQRDRFRQTINDALYYGACGMLIAMALAVAEPLSARNPHAALAAGAVGAALGLAGGLLAWLLADRLYAALHNDGSLRAAMLARALTWAVLGLFLSAAAGLTMRNYKKLLAGLAGGLLGGLLGGALFDPIARIAPEFLGQPDALSRLVALAAIGMVAGAATALIENAAKSGWIKVTAGLIAGKQFIIYRNPTFIGSAHQCQIYLFKDPTIGRRHAAIHITPAGYYIEDLGSGSPTRINGRAPSRHLLRPGDRIQIGATTLTFHEKPKAGHN